MNKLSQLPPVLDMIETIPDYPYAGINFYDLNSLFATKWWPLYVKEMAKLVNRSAIHGETITHIVGIESRGFVVGSALAQTMGLPFCMIRKEGAKYPGELLSESYGLEYGEDAIVLQTGVLDENSRVLLADDLIATGGSAGAAIKLVKQTGAKLAGIATVLNLRYLNNYSGIGTPIYALETIDSPE